MALSFIKNEIVPRVFAMAPFASLQKLTGVIPLIPYYHGVSDDHVPHVKHLYQFKNVQQFTKDLNTFLRLYKPIDLRDFVNSLNKHVQLPNNSLLLTFDDGFREQHDVVAPLLWEKGVPATFFLIAGCLDNMDMPYDNKVSLLIEHLIRIGTNNHRKRLLQILADCGLRQTNLRTALLSLNYAKKYVLDEIASVLHFDFTEYLVKSRPYLTSDQVRKLISMGFTIGAHSMDHPKYSLISLPEQLYQTRTSIRSIRERFSLDYGAFAFPNGDDNMSHQFFKQIFADGNIDASFGNLALLTRAHPRDFPRLPMENTCASAERIIGRYYAHALYHRILGHHSIIYHP